MPLLWWYENHSTAPLSRRYHVWPIEPRGEINMVADTPIAVLLGGLLDAFNAHDIDRVVRFFADDCVLQMPRGPNPTG